MTISVIVPVLNEGPVIRETLRSLRESALPDTIQIVLVDGGSTDGSIEAAQDAADAVVHTRRGRAHQMHAGALAATGNLLLFLHADTRLPEKWVPVLREAWARNPPPASTAFRMSFDLSAFRYKLIATAAALRFRLTGVAHGDQAMAVRRDAYMAAGGYPDVPLMEEYFLTRKLRPWGSTRLLSPSVVTSSRRYEKNGPLLNALRNTFLVTLFYLGVSPMRLARLYR